MNSTWLVGLVCLSAGVTRGEDLHVMAFNVLFHGSDDLKSVKAIEATSADVVCLTELTPKFIKTFESSAVLMKAYPHRAFVPKKGTWGVGFVSKRPLSNVQTGAVAPSKIPAMEATVQVDGKSVRLVCVHLMPPVGKHAKSDTFFDALEKNAAVRKKQAVTLVDRYAAVKTPVVLLGDFNEEPGGQALRVLEKAGWSRGCDLAESSCTPTFPGSVVAWPAVFSIDHVFARGLEFTESRTLKLGGSDHYPVTAIMSFGPPGRLGEGP